MQFFGLAYLWMLPQRKFFTPPLLEKKQYNYKNIYFLNPKTLKHNDLYSILSAKQDKSTLKKKPNILSLQKGGLNLPNRANLEMHSVEG